MELLLQKMQSEKYPSIFHFSFSIFLHRNVLQFQPRNLNFKALVSCMNLHIDMELELGSATAKRKQEEIRMRMMWDESIEGIRREDMWFAAVKSGTNQDIETMQDLLAEDPNNFFCSDDPRKLINAGRRQFPNRTNRS